MKEKPILFSTPMVQATLDVRKTMTRRVVKNLVGATSVEDIYHRPDGLYIGTHLKVGDGQGVTLPFRCPYGNIGDQLWVRETYRIINHSGTASKYFYKADACQTDINDNEIKWKPSIFMPKEACRIRLEITNIRVERLQDISQEDSKAEGIYTMPHRPASEGCTPHKDKSFSRDCFVCAFKFLWNTINGESGNGWDTNPWLWVIEFKVLTNLNPHVK